MMALVIDANIAVAWFRPNASKIAELALDALVDDGAVVPALWRWEVQDVLRRLAAAGHMTLPVEDALAEMRQLPITVDDGLMGLFGSESELADEYRLSAYDAAYLEVALRRGLPLATLDRELAVAAKRANCAFP